MNAQNTDRTGRKDRTDHPEPPPARQARGPKVQAAVLAAARQELAEAGYAALTVENVARRAGVHKTTVYRRWKDRETLVTEALTEHLAASILIPDTGAFESDLRELARRMVRSITSVDEQGVTAALYSDAGRLPEIAAVRQGLFADRFRRAAPLVERAVDRGELPEGTDPALLLKSLIAPVYLRLLVLSEPLDDAVADHAADITLAAARAGLFRRT
ncbi:TetR/AcrR family transcriptional regulator [Streptomyces albiaxialis]|uniref:TetR/AcrR family transcriptional regulator n=1 Tax=Streptomyces albiaxialis TaxID=329523 RepID=A0ABP5H501_9ACTN